VPWQSQPLYGQSVIEVDGFARSSSNNKITDMIEGVTLDLVKAEPGTVFNLSVSADTEAAKNPSTSL